MDYLSQNNPLEVRKMESYQEPDYKELYFSLFRASEKAIRILIQAQQECEEQVLSAGETDCSPE